MLAVDDLVHLPEEGDRFEVVPPALLVGNPLPVLAGIVEVEHRRHAVDTEPVGVELLHPVQGVGDQEVAHLVAPES